MKQLATSRIVRHIEVKLTQPQAHTLTEAQATSRIWWKCSIEVK